MSMWHWKLPVTLAAIILVSATVVWANREETSVEVAEVVLDRVVIDSEPDKWIHKTHFFVRWRFDDHSLAWQMNETIPTRMCPNPRVGELRDVLYIRHRTIHVYSRDYYTTVGADVFCK